VPALAGSLGVLALAVALPRLGAAAALGRQSMALLGLSGVFYHFVNPLLLTHWPLPDSVLAATLQVTLITAVSLASVYPVAWLLMRWYPALLGVSRPAARQVTMAGPTR
jgi:hypothetical protein